jgi:hypothetical protein
MSDSSQVVQHKSTRAEEQRLDEFARDQLQAVLPASIVSGFESGAVICRAFGSGALSATPVRTGKVKHTVSVGTDLPNCGCPAGTTPVAYFHTHPSAAGTSATQGGTVAKSFSDDDLDVAKDYGLIAYVATRDGSMWRYDPPRDVVFIDGVRTVSDRPETPAADPDAPPGVKFNWRLRTR